MLTIPKALHDVFGEEQDGLSIALIAALGLGIAGFFVFVAAGELAALAWYRSAAAVVLVADIAAGCVANFTRGTSSFYAARPRNRLVFIAIHIHLPAVAFLMGWSIEPFALIWAYTIAGALLVNALPWGNVQRTVAGAALAAALCVMPMLEGMTPIGVGVSALFVVKVLYSFAVVHGEAGQGHEKEPA